MSFRYLLESQLFLFSWRFECCELGYKNLESEIQIFLRHNFPPDRYPEYFAEIWFFFRHAWAFKNIFGVPSAVNKHDNYATGICGKIWVMPAHAIPTSLQILLLIHFSKL